MFVIEPQQDDCSFVVFAVTGISVKGVSGSITAGAEISLTEPPVPHAIGLANAGVAIEVIIASDITVAMTFSQFIITPIKNI